MTRCAHRTPEKIAMAKRLYASGFNYRQIAIEMGLTCGSLVRSWIDEEYAEYRRQKVRARRQGIGGSPIRVDKTATKSAALLLAQIPPDTRDLTARLCGDPLPGRRAIDKKEMGLGQHEVPFQ